MPTDLPKMDPLRSRPRPRGDRRSASWQKKEAEDPSDSASTLTRENAALLKHSLCSAMGVSATRFPGAAAPSPRPSVTPRSPSLADIFGQSAMRPTVTPIRLEDRFSAAASGAVAPTQEADAGEEARGGAVAASTQDAEEARAPRDTAREPTDA